MEIKKGSKWTCIKDVVIGYKLCIFNASEVYESPIDNQLTDNAGKTRYVCSSWFQNFVKNEVPAGKRSAPQNDSSRILKPQDSEACKTTSEDNQQTEDIKTQKLFENNGELPSHKKADLDESLKDWIKRLVPLKDRIHPRKVVDEFLKEKLSETYWNMNVGDKPNADKIEMLYLNKEVESALELEKASFKMAGNLGLKATTPKQWCFNNNSSTRDVSKVESLNLKKKELEELRKNLNQPYSDIPKAEGFERDGYGNFSYNTIPKKLTPEFVKESDAKEWLKYKEEYSNKRGYNLGETELKGIRLKLADGSWENHYLKEQTPFVKDKKDSENSNGDFWNAIYGGKSAVIEKTGIKNDSDKLPYYSVLFEQFPLALKEVVKCSKAGHLKYHKTDHDMQNFSRVEKGETRYKDAMLRHMTESGQIEDMVEYGEITHEGAVVWNALADLEVKLRKLK